MVPIAPEFYRFCIPKTITFPWKSEEAFESSDRKFNYRTVCHVIYTTGREINLPKSILTQNASLTTVPLMVLVNGRSASASEIVAAALHDNCRAILVGEKTFGKGLIQSVYELKDGSGVVVTVGKYVTPSHRDIDGNGIEPDFYRRPGLNEAKKTIARCHASASTNLMTQKEVL